jgi:preprotein translocase subunit Sec61beta
MDHQIDPDAAFIVAVQVIGMVLWIALLAGLFYWGVLP